MRKADSMKRVSLKEKGAIKKGGGKLLLASGILLLALILVGLVGVLEKGPISIPLTVGAHPFNRGPFGAHSLYSMLSSNYTVIPAYNWSQALAQLANCSKALIIIVSPEIQYTQGDAEAIRMFKDKCEELALIIGDETGNSNRVLEALNSTIRVRGVLSPNPHPVVSIETPWGWHGLLALDKASTLTTMGAPTLIGWDLLTGEAYAYYEDMGSFKAVVIGDGSIFLNQVLQSNVSEPYKGFISSTVMHLCGGDCIIYLEASKYQSLDPMKALEYMRSPQRAALIDPSSLLATIIANAIHPSTWMPPLLNYINNLMLNLSRDVSLAGILMIFSVLALTLILMSRMERVPDAFLEDVREVEWYGYGEFSRRILVEGARLGKKDFLTLYTIVDGIFRSLTGVSLESEDAVRVLESRGVEGAKAREYWLFMNKYYRKALGKTLWPPVVFWGKVCRESIELSEAMLRALGASLMEVKGLEERIS